MGIGEVGICWRNSGLEIKMKVYIMIAIITDEDSDIESVITAAFSDKQSAEISARNFEAITNKDFESDNELESSVVDVRVLETEILDRPINREYPVEIQ